MNVIIHCKLSIECKLLVFCQGLVVCYCSNLDYHAEAEIPVRQFGAKRSSTLTEIWTQANHFSSLLLKFIFRAKRSSTLTEIWTQTPFFFFSS